MTRGYIVPMLYYIELYETVLFFFFFLGVKNIEIAISFGST